MTGTRLDRGALGEEPEGATPLSEEDMEGLIPAWVTTRADLNLVEAENIVRARTWLAGRRRQRVFRYLDEAGLRQLHRRMFAEVWRWAGQLRQRETNIGADPYYISVRLWDLHDDVLAQVGDGSDTAYPTDEIAVRFHHRLVAIHPFANGNGRHSRLAADLLSTELGGQPFTWGGAELTDASALRSEYVNALRVADRTGAVDDLLLFARRA